jgi:hypothetical protein
MFLEDFNSINNPINLRDRLEFKVKDSVGLFASGIIINMKYEKNLSFWENAKKYYKKLLKKRKSDDAFKIFRIISRAVPLKYIEEFGPIFLELQSKGKPFAITNLGSLDKLNLISKSNDLEIEYIFGGVSSSFNAIILTLFTIQKQMHFHLHYYAPPYKEEEISKYLKNAINKLKHALDS